MQESIAALSEMIKLSKEEFEASLTSTNTLFAENIKS
jgi:hypothetical protein